MHFNHKQLAVSMAVGAALVASWYPANLNARTVAINSSIPAEASAPTASAQADATTSQAVTTALPTAASTGNGEAHSGTVLIVQQPGAIDIWLDKLAYKESGNNAELKILDVNGQYSYGCLQFQEGTFQTYGRKYGLISRGTPTEPAIYNCDLQKKIAKRMIAEDYSNWQAWYNSSKSKDVGLPPK